MSCTFLDYIWSGLAAASVASMLMLSVLWLASKVLLERVSARRLKWFFHSQYSVIALTVTSSFALAAYLNPELANGCFAKFAANSEGFALTRALAGTWLAGVVAMISWDLLSAVRSHRALRGMSVQDSANLEAWTEKMGIRRKVELLISENSKSPYIFGWFKHRIVVSQEFLKSESLGPVLAHELAHAYDNDSFWMLWERVCRRVLFFNPIIYILSSTYQIVVERAADELAISKGGVAPRRLAEALVSVAEAMVYEPSALELGVGRCYRDLRFRIESLGRRQNPREGFAIVVGAALFLSACAAWAQLEMSSQPSGQWICRQVQHEKAIEALFLMKSEDEKTCEENNP